MDSNLVRIICRVIYLLNSITEDVPPTADTVEDKQSAEGRVDDPHKKLCWPLS
jgi:hypothetical protein